MKIHFIAIGGSVMHNLAIALHKKGYHITGSDDEIFEPAKSRLARYDLLPATPGWDAGKINSSLDAIILGMHARIDNPELRKANELSIKIYSFPEYLYEQTKNKMRVVIAGSHGKTTITAMIMHCLKNNGYKFDYMVGSLIEGFETMVEIKDENNIAVFEGDEYFTSAIDKRPKFHLYKPHVGLITGIAWDHMNVFPAFENYVEQFRIFSELTTNSLVYYEGDPILNEIANKHKERLNLYPYNELPVIKRGKTVLIKDDKIDKFLESFSLNEIYKEKENDDEKTEKNLSGIISSNILSASQDKEIVLQIFGKHNMQNLSGAMRVCDLLGLSPKKFLVSMTSFKGAAKRQEYITGNDLYDVYLDFAHAPSKVKATVDSFKQQFDNKKIIACLELHTFSSLNPAFLPQYHNSLKLADEAIIFCDPEVVKHKNLPEISSEQLFSAFNRRDLYIINKREEIEPTIMKLKRDNSVLLFMTSGNLSGLDIRAIANRFIKNDHGITRSKDQV